MLFQNKNFVLFKNGKSSSPTSYSKLALEGKQHLIIQILWNMNPPNISHWILRVNCVSISYSLSYFRNDWTFWHSWVRKQECRRRIWKSISTIIRKPKSIQTPLLIHTQHIYATYLRICTLLGDLNIIAVDKSIANGRMNTSTPHIYEHPAYYL